MRKLRLGAGRPHERTQDSGIRYGLEELKFVTTFEDLKILCKKMTFLMPRAIGALGKAGRTPPSLQIEPTHHCNVNCICCPISRSSRRRGYMDFDLFKKIADDASQCGVERVRLFLHGEPFLHPQIVEMIRYLKSQDIAVYVTTNGILFDKAKIEAVLSSGVNYADHFTFSVLGYSKAVHERIMRGGDHDRTVKNILDFVELRRKHGANGPVIETIIYAMPENEHELKQYLNYWRGKVDHARFGGRVSVSFSEYKGKEETVILRTQTCPSLWDRMTVFWNGDVTICSEDVDGEWVLGNLSEQTIGEIWNCERLSALRIVHREKRFEEFPFCQRCDL